MRTVLHINDKLALAGGVEVYISQVLPLLRELGWASQWVAISRTGKQVRIDCEDKALQWQGAVADLPKSPLGRCVGNPESLLHVHSLSDPVLMQGLFELAPVVRTMHEPRVFCPGQGKFWAKTERVCTIPAGLHCFFHAYKEGCCNRHPKRLFPAYQNVQFELQEASRRYAKMIACSSYIKTEALAAGVPEDQVEVLNYLTPLVDKVSEPGHRRIVFAGRLSKTKGVHHLLEAFEQVARTLPDAHLDLLGAGNDEPKFIGLAKSLKIEERITFHGWADREAVDRYLNLANVVAFPSIYPEAFGISGIEAMMRGKPVVAYDVGGVSDWLEDGVTGTLVPAKDINGLANAITALLRNPERAMRYGELGRENALRFFNPERHLVKLIGIYEEALAKSC